MKVWISRLTRSWTIWFNSIFGTLLAFWPFLADNIVSIQPYLTDHAYKWIAGVLVAGNIILRFKTSQALRNK